MKFNDDLVQLCDSACALAAADGARATGDVHLFTAFAQDSPESLANDLGIHPEVLAMLQPEQTAATATTTQLPPLSRRLKRRLAHLAITKPPLTCEEAIRELIRKPSRRLEAMIRRLKSASIDMDAGDDEPAGTQPESVATHRFHETEPEKTPAPYLTDPDFWFPPHALPVRKLNILPDGVFGADRLAKPRDPEFAELINAEDDDDHLSIDGVSIVFLDPDTD